MINILHLFTIKNIAARAHSTLALGIFITVFGFLTACTEKKPEFKGIDITGADYAQNFKLEDQFGKTRTMADFKGKAVVVFSVLPNAPTRAPRPWPSWPR